jgi:hypothetical protein
MLGKSLLLAVGLVACVSAQGYKERYAQRCTRQGIHPMSRGACESAYIQVNYLIFFFKFQIIFTISVRRRRP